MDCFGSARESSEMVLLLVLDETNRRMSSSVECRVSSARPLTSPLPRDTSPLFPRYEAARRLQLAEPNEVAGVDFATCKLSGSS